MIRKTLLVVLGCFFAASLALAQTQIDPPSTWTQYSKEGWATNELDLPLTGAQNGPSNCSGHALLLVTAFGDTTFDPEDPGGSYGTDNEVARGWISQDPGQGGQRTLSLDIYESDCRSGFYSNGYQEEASVESGLDFSGSLWYLHLYRVHTPEPGGNANFFGSFTYFLELHDAGTIGNY